MDTLVFLCARRLVAHLPGARRALDLLPAELFPVLFRAAIADGRVLALRELVATWPFPVLSFPRILGHQDHHQDGHQVGHRDGHPLPMEKPRRSCVQAVILAVVAQLRRALDGAARGTSENRCHLRFLDMTGLQDNSTTTTSGGAEGMTLWSNTVALAKASLEISKHQTQCLKRASKRHKGPTNTSTSPPPIGVDIKTDLFVNSTSFGVVRDALQHQSLLRLRCRDFHAEELSIAALVTLVESLEDPVEVRRVDLRFNNLKLAGLCVVVPYLTRFTHLLSLKLPYSNVDVRRSAPGMEAALRCLAAHLGKLANLKELNLGSSRLSGKLRQFLGDLQTPLESLELAFCYLLPGDFSFLSQSFHAPKLKKLDLSGHDFSNHLLQPLQHLLEETSTSLLHLDLMECHLTDTGLEVLFPTLSRCSHLRSLGLFGNPLSTPGLKKVLRTMVALEDLNLVVYPCPTDCYLQEPPRSTSPPNQLFEDAVDEELLAAVKVELDQMLVSLGRTDMVWTSNLCQRGDLLDVITMEFGQSSTMGGGRGVAAAP